MNPEQAFRHRYPTASAILFVLLIFILFGPPIGYFWMWVFFIRESPKVLYFLPFSYLFIGLAAFTGLLDSAGVWAMIRWGFPRLHLRRYGWLVFGILWGGICGFLGYLLPPLIRWGQLPEYQFPELAYQCVAVLAAATCGGLSLPGVLRRMQHPGEVEYYPSLTSTAQTQVSVLRVLTGLVAGLVLLWIGWIAYYVRHNEVQVTSRSTVWQEPARGESFVGQVDFRIQENLVTILCSDGVGRYFRLYGVRLPRMGEPEPPNLSKVWWALLPRGGKLKMIVRKPGHGLPSYVEIFLPDGRSFNQELIKAGVAQPD